jgi:23S rRNA (pseudouridine1915-N3)-methyltransferase
MKISFITVGKDFDVSLKDKIDDYTKRVGRYYPMEWKVIASSEIKKETEDILKAIKPEDFVYALDEIGKELNTIELSQKIEKNTISGVKTVIFVIGGAYGLGQEVRDRANFVWSLSKLTFPHQLVRLILAESVYRAISVLKNEPYHHA